jgi:hypothetical protein
MATLACENWQEASFDDIVVAFLRAEAHKYDDLTDREVQLIRTPDTQVHDENLARCHLLARKRGGLFAALPPDTRWYRVQYLRNEHLDELLVLRYESWVSDTDLNELGNVASRKTISFREEPKKKENRNQVVELPTAMASGFTT